MTIFITCFVGLQLKHNIYLLFLIFHTLFILHFILLILYMNIDSTVKYPLKVEGESHLQYVVCSYSTAPRQ